MAMNDGGPAFPVPYQASTRGMSIRDYTAIKVMAAALSSAHGLGTIPKEDRAPLFKELAALCFEAADALTATRQGSE